MITHQLKLHHTEKNILYGTSEMAIAVKQLPTKNQHSQCKIFTQLGHQDGVISYGDNFAEATLLLIDTLANSKIIIK